MHMQVGITLTIANRFETQLQRFYLYHDDNEGERDFFVTAMKQPTYFKHTSGCPSGCGLALREEASSCNSRVIGVLIVQGPSPKPLLM